MLLTILTKFRYNIHMMKVIPEKRRVW